MMELSECRYYLKFGDLFSASLMGVTDRVWGALTSMIKLEDRVIRQSEVIKTQQDKIENLTERVIKLETTLELLMRASE
jgi:hypothetical protein